MVTLENLSSALENEIKEREKIGHWINQKLRSTLVQMSDKMKNAVAEFHNQLEQEREARIRVEQQNEKLLAGCKVLKQEIEILRSATGSVNQEQVQKMVLLATLEQQSMLLTKMNDLEDKVLSTQASKGVTEEEKYQRRELKEKKRSEELSLALTKLKGELKAESSGGDVTKEAVEEMLMEKLQQLKTGFKTALEVQQTSLENKLAEAISNGNVDAGHNPSGGNSDTAETRVAVSKLEDELNRLQDRVSSMAASTSSSGEARGTVMSREVVQELIEARLQGALQGIKTSLIQQQERLTSIIDSRLATLSSSAPPAAPSDDHERRYEERKSREREEQERIRREEEEMKRRKEEMRQREEMAAKKQRMEEERRQQEQEQLRLAEEQRRREADQKKRQQAEEEERRRRAVEEEERRRRAEAEAEEEERRKREDERQRRKEEEEERKRKEAAVEEENRRREAEAKEEATRKQDSLFSEDDLFGENLFSGSSSRRKSKSSAPKGLFIDDASDSKLFGDTLGSDALFDSDEFFGSPSKRERKGRPRRTSLGLFD